MVLTEARKATLMAYCRIDELLPGEDALLEAVYAAAVQYMEQAGVAQPAAGTAREGQYNLAVNALVLDAWDNRGSQGVGISFADNPAFRRLMNQLKLTEPVSNSDTGGGA